MMTSKETDAMWGGWNKEVSGPLFSGVYETRHFGDPEGATAYQHWTGEYWCMPNSDISAAAASREKSGLQKISFRPLQNPLDRERYGPSPLGRQHFEPKPGHGPAPAAEPAPSWESPGQEFEPEPASALDTQVGGDHYKKLKIQPMEYSMANGLDACQHSVVRYVTRFRDKGGIQELEKAKHCIDMLIELETRGGK